MTVVKEYIQEHATWVHHALDEYTKSWDRVPEVLKESVRYSLLAGGKRLRPVLVLASTEAVGGEMKKALPFACALEMIHTYSLIHDDLPSMDNDDYRRGKLTNHKVFGEAQAILAGDTLLTEAFGLMAKGAREANLPLDTALSIIEEGSQSAGAFGMVGGQVSDLLAENRQVSLEELESIHRRKTGDLIAYAVRTGARVAGASEEVLEALTQFAYDLGLAFQIQDDILDVEGDASLIGKPVGSDQERNKSTYPALLGLSQSKLKLKELTDRAKDAIRNHPEIRAENLLLIADYLLSRDR